MVCFKLLVAAIGFTSFVFSCGKLGSSSNGDKNGAPPKDGDNGTNYDEIYKEKVLKNYPSDISEENLSRCKEGQPFAFGKCWDALFISDEGEVSLNQGNSKEVLFNKENLYVSPLISKYFYYSYSFSQNDMRISNKFMENKILLSNHWFLPSNIQLTDTRLDHIIDGQKLRGGTFTLIETESFYGVIGKTDTVIFNQFQGKIKLKGNLYDLPISQKTIETVCENGKPMGDGYFLECTSENRNVIFKFGMVRKPNDKGADPAWTQRRIATSVEIEMH